MVQVNLIGKKRRQSKGKSSLLTIGIIVYGLILIYFFGSAIYSVYRVTSLNIQLSSIEKETRSVSDEILKNNTELNRFVLSKFVIGKIQSLNNSRFRYKDYLDEISGLMPAGTLLKNVDFGKPGWVSVLFYAKDLQTLRLLEISIGDKDSINTNLFSSVYTESVTRDLSGAYSVKLQFEAKKNVGK